ncbi:RapZ C-terminal domain-containing protein [Streptomyces sp. NPDC000941]
MTDAFIDSFGARWQDPPPAQHRAAVLSVNVTDALLNPPDDPNVKDVLAQQTGLDPAVRDYVLATPGASQIVDDTVHQALALLAGRAHGDTRPVQVLVNCWYGKHRAPALAEEIGRSLRSHGVQTAVAHRHIGRPPVPRKYPRADCPFCAIVHDGAPATIVHEWADALAFLPRADDRGRRGCTEGHLLVIPKVHVNDFTVDPVVSATVQMRAAELAALRGGQWNYLTSCGPDATQTVFHLHGHLVPRIAGDGLTLPWTHPTPAQEPTR